MLRLGGCWSPIDPQSPCRSRDVFDGDVLFARIVDTTAEIYLTNAPRVRIYEADLLHAQVWEPGHERFTDEASALRSIEERLKSQR